MSLVSCPKAYAYAKYEHFGLFVFELCCGQTNTQTDRQTDGLENLTHADRGN